MKRGLLLIDRGSREKEVQDELRYICDKVKTKGNYFFCDYCFLEVIPPFIKEGIEKCLSNGIDALTIVPYFLYPGKKVKAAVNMAISMQSKTKTKITIAKPMTLHRSMIEIVDEKIGSALRKNNIVLPKKEVDVLIICHGSKDPNARTSIKYVVDGLSAPYRNIDYCFLEIEEPNIAQGIEKCVKNSPKVLIVMFYFLHEGAHVKRDIYTDLNPAIEKSKLTNVFVTDHLGTDEKMIDLVVERAREVER
jgi:sirohydrochlorin ferrochelatase